MTFVIKLAQGLEKLSPLFPSPKADREGKVRHERKIRDVEAPARWKSWEKSNKMLLVVRLKHSRFQSSKSHSNCFTGGR